MMYKKLHTTGKCKMRGKRFIAAMLVAVTCFVSIVFEGSAAKADGFDDVDPKAWYYAEVAAAVDAGLFSGTSSYHFEPLKNISRAGFVTAVANLCNADVSSYTTEPFTDVPANHWAQKSIAWAYKKGIVSGISASKFAPEREISRQEMCVILVATIEKIFGENLTLGNLNGFSDRGMIANWAKDAVKKCVRAKLIAGSGGKFNPLGKATRAAAAAVFHRYHQTNQADPLLEVSGFYLNFRSDQDYYVSTNADFNNCKIIKYNGSGSISSIVVEHYPTEQKFTYSVGQKMNMGMGRAKIYITIGGKKYTIDVTDADHADYTFGRTNGANLNVRSGPGTGHSIVTTLSTSNVRIYYYGSEINGAGEEWCRIQIADSNHSAYRKTGYILRKYVKWSYPEVSMPARYKAKIEALKKAHPNWSFSFVNVGVDYEDAPAKYNSTQSYIDPINYLNENDIYAFLDIDSYQFGSWTAEQVAAIWLEKEGAIFTEEEAVAQIMTTSKSVMMNPLYIACRMGLESSYGSSAFAKGMSKVTNVTVDGIYYSKDKNQYYDLGGTYYNFFGIGAYDYNPNNAMITAKRTYDWHTPERALVGGAHYIKEWYLDRGNITPYFFRYAHMTDNAYMTDVAAPKKEAEILKRAYTDPKAQAHFIVPVYRNMPS